MPDRIKRPCRIPGCANYTTAKSGYCDKHKHYGWHNYQNVLGKGNQNKRYGHTWRKTRDKILSRDCGVCQPCKRRGIVTAATIVDHIKPKAKGGTDSPENLEAICKACHAKKTARDRL